MDWLDYFSPVDFTKTTTKLTDDNGCRLLRDDCNDEQVNKAKWVWSISQEITKEYFSDCGRTFQVDLEKERFFVVHEPLIHEKKQKSMPLLFFMMVLISGVELLESDIPSEETFLLVIAKTQVYHDN